jgi:hypothetical protein
LALLESGGGLPIIEEAELTPNLISPLVVKMKQDNNSLIWASCGIKYQII